MDKWQTIDAVRDEWLDAPLEIVTMFCCMIQYPHTLLYPVQNGEAYDIDETIVIGNIIAHHKTPPSTCDRGRFIYRMGSISVYTRAVTRGDEVVLHADGYLNTIIREFYIDGDRCISRGMGYRFSDGCTTLVESESAALNAKWGNGPVEYHSLWDASRNTSVTIKWDPQHRTPTLKDVMGQIVHQLYD
jgi:hypothetical protein